MSQLFQQSFTPWETAQHDEKYNNFLKLPLQTQIKIKNNSFKHTDNSSQYIQTKKQTHRDTRNYFLNKNKIVTKKADNYFQRDNIKKLYQSMHFQGILTDQKSIQMKPPPKRQAFNTIINFAYKRKSLKQKIQRTKKLLQKNQKNSSTSYQTPLKSQQNKQIQASLKKLLSLNKTNSCFSLSNFSNVAISSTSSPSIDSFFQTKKQINFQQRNVTKANQRHKKNKYSSVDFNTSQKFLDSKDHIASLKKKIYNQTFYKSAKFQKCMNLPKIEILDWQKPQL